MSYILDALKKSDQQRQQQSAPGIHSSPRSSAGNVKRTVPIWLPIVGVLVIVNIMFWPDSETKPSPDTRMIELVKPIQLPADYSDTRHGLDVPTPTSQNTTERTDVTRVAPATTVTTPEQDTTPDNTATSRDPFTPLIAMPKPVKPPKRQTAQRDSQQGNAIKTAIRPNLPTPDMLKLQQTLVRQQIMNSLPATETERPKPKAVANAQTTPTRPTKVDKRADTPPLQTARQQPAFDVWEKAARSHPTPRQDKKPAPSLPISEQAGNIPNRLELPENIQQDLPEIDVSVHIFAHEPAQRRARVNGRMHYQGDQLAAGLTLEEITPQALIFSYKNNLFRISP